MDKLEADVFASLKGLNIRLTEKLSDRKTADHSIYLVQCLAYDLRLRHEWYGHPSSEYLRTLFHKHLFEPGKEERDKEIEGIEISKKYKEMLSRVSQFIDPPEQISRWAWTDVLSSLHYFRNICGVKADFKKTFRELNKNRETPPIINSRFSGREFDLAWSRIEEYGLLDKKHNRPE